MMTASTLCLFLHTQLAATVEEDANLEALLIKLLCNLSGFKNNQHKLGETHKKHGLKPLHRDEYCCTKTTFSSTNVVLVLNTALEPHHHDTVDPQVHDLGK